MLGDRIEEIVQNQNLLKKILIQILPRIVENLEPENEIKKENSRGRRSLSAHNKEGKLLLLQL